MTQLVLAFVAGLIVGEVTVLFAIALLSAGRSKDEDC